MKSTIAEVEKAGLRDNLKIIIGGGQMDDTVRKYTGADAYGDDAMAAVAFAKAVVGAA
jgi:5-methyltetrahydrofolate--homocysteine methyltransferase